MKKQDLLSISFYDKSKLPFTGSEGALRYRVEKVICNTSGDEPPKKQLRATVWHGQFAFDHTPEDEKTSEDFEYSDEGLFKITDWINSFL